MMQRNVPGAFTALREPADHDALVVDVKAFLNRSDGFEDVRFAGPMPARTIDAAKAIELDLSLVRDRRIAGSTTVQKTVNELGFGGCVLASVQPDVKTSRLAGIVIVRQRHAVGKNRSVNLRGVSMNPPLALVPLRLISLKLFPALNALIESGEGVFKGVLIGEHVRIFEEHLAGVRIDLDVAHQFRIGALRFQILHESVNLLGLFFDLRQLFGLGLDGWRSATAPSAASAGGWRRLRLLRGTRLRNKPRQSEGEGY